MEAHLGGRFPRSAPAPPAALGRGGPLHVLGVRILQVLVEVEDLAVRKLLFQRRLRHRVDRHYLAPEGLLAALLLCPHIVRAILERCAGELALVI